MPAANLLLIFFLGSESQLSPFFLFFFGYHSPSSFTISLSLSQPLSFKLDRSQVLCRVLKEAGRLGSLSRFYSRRPRTPPHPSSPPSSTGIQERTTVSPLTLECVYPPFQPIGSPHDLDESVKQNEKKKPTTTIPRRNATPAVHTCSLSAYQPIQQSFMDGPLV